MSTLDPQSSHDPQTSQGTFPSQVPLTTLVPRIESLLAELFTKIEDVRDFHPRLKRALKTAKITLIGDIITSSEKQLIKTEGIGPIFIRDIKKYLLSRRIGYIRDVATAWEEIKNLYYKNNKKEFYNILGNQYLEILSFIANDFEKIAMREDIKALETEIRDLKGILIDQEQISTVKEPYQTPEKSLSYENNSNGRGLDGETGFLFIIVVVVLIIRAIIFTFS